MGKPSPARFWPEHLPGSVRAGAGFPAAARGRRRAGAARRCGRRTLYAPIINPLALTVQAGLFACLRQVWRWAGVGTRPRAPSAGLWVCQTLVRRLLNESPGSYPQTWKPEKRGGVTKLPRRLPHRAPRRGPKESERNVTSELSVQSSTGPGVSRPMDRRQGRGLRVPGSGAGRQARRGAMAAAASAAERVPSRGAPGEVIHLNVGGKR